MSDVSKPATLRELLAFLAKAETTKGTPTDWLDAEVFFVVCDGHRNNRETMALRLDYWLLPRSDAHASTGEPARLNLLVSLDDHRLVRERKL